MLPTVDLVVLGAYLVAVVCIGLWLGSRGGGADDFMAAGRSLPGWAIGLSMFGSYISSISFLANPGKAFATNWNAVAFTLATPIAAAIAVRWFVPFYIREGAISAYEHLEKRFGRWARTYAVFCFLLYQMARMGTVVYLLALAVAPLTGWQIETTIVLTGALMTVYTLAGGIKAVVWVGVLQSGVLITGTLVCLAAVILKTPGGVREILDVVCRQQFGELGLELDEFAEVAGIRQLHGVDGSVLVLGEDDRVDHTDGARFDQFEQFLGDLTGEILLPRREVDDEIVHRSQRR